MLFIRSLVFAVAFYVTTAAFLILGAPILLIPRRWAMPALQLHARCCLWLLKAIVGTTLEVRGRENLPAGAALVAAKHQSAWETFALIPLFCDPAMVMKAELGWIPLYGWFSLKFGHILVRRQRGPAALRALIVAAGDRLREGRQIVIFPEGTRQPVGAPPTYKSGILALYEGLDVPCVPIALNSGLYWPRRGLIRYPGTIVVQVLPAIEPGLARAEFKARLEAVIEEATAKLVAEAGIGQLAHV